MFSLVYLCVLELMPALKKNIGFNDVFRKGYDLYDEECSRWLESDHPDTLPNQESSKQMVFVVPHLLYIVMMIV